MDISSKIKTILEREFSPLHLEIQDDSRSHTGHQQVQESGGKHYSLVIVSDKFKGKSLLERHRLIYAVFEKELKKDIHALALKAYTAEEYARLSP